jgi:hypothetical protein
MRYSYRSSVHLHILHRLQHKKVIVHHRSNRSSNRSSNMTDLLMYEYYAMTTDHWTSIANVNYLAATVHFIDKDWKLKAAPS